MAGPSEHQLDLCRRLMAAALRAPGLDIGPVVGKDCSTELRADLLGAWRKAAQDPDDLVEEWLRTGAPCGIEKQIESRGIFPVVDDEVGFALELPRTEPDGFRNCAAWKKKKMTSGRSWAGSRCTASWKGWTRMTRS